MERRREKEAGEGARAESAKPLTEKGVPLTPKIVWVGVTVMLDSVICQGNVHPFCSNEAAIETEVSTRETFEIETGKESNPPTLTNEKDEEEMLACVDVWPL